MPTDSKDHNFRWWSFKKYPVDFVEKTSSFLNALIVQRPVAKDEINVPIALSAFRDNAEAKALKDP